MQKHFAVVTGIGMLAVAGIVVSQQAGLFDSSLQGSLTNSFPTMTSSVPGGFTPPAFPMSLISSAAPCGGSRGMCGGTCGTPGWTCQWDPRASNGSCVCTDPGFCNSVPSCGTALAPAGDPRCGTTVDCCNAGIRSTTVVQCSSPSSSPLSPCADNGGAPGTGGCCAGAVEVNGGCWQPCTGPNMGPGCTSTSSNGAGTTGGGMSGTTGGMGGTMGGTGGFGTSTSSAGGCASCPSICGNGVTTNCCNISTNSCN